MLSASTVVIAGLVWVLLLFAVALYGERRSERFARLWPAIYALSLAVYCTAWTFYGTVTQAARWNTPIPPTFIGTILLFVLAMPFMRRLAALAQAQNSASLADLIASRFGKDPRLAALITAVAVLGMVPYVALQLKAVAMSYAMLTGGAAHVPAWQDAAFWIAVVMALFAMLFGTRRAAATEHNRGLVLAVAFESLIKLAAMLAVGAFVVFGMHDGLGALAARVPAAFDGRPDSGFFALVALGAVAMFTLPHQFHLGVVELRDRRHLRTARWLFPLYLLLIAAPILPLAWAGQLAFGDMVPSDLYVLALPLSEGHHALALLTFLGGVSAATGMVILVALTLSIMIANHWFAPRVVRSAGAESGDLRGVVLRHRRYAIAFVVLLAWAYSRAMVASEALADIGALSFSALALLAPAIVAAVYRPRLPARAVFNGLVVGIAFWSWIILLPLASDLAGHGAPKFPAWLTWLEPAQFLGLGGLDRLARGTVVSLFAITVAMLWRARHGEASDGHATGRIESSVLRALVSRFLPEAQSAALFDAAERYAGVERIARVERELAPVIGAASARLLVEAAGRTPAATLERVAEFVGEASQTLRFNQQILEAALENMSQGISVVDADLRLVAWNRRYAERFDYPPELLRVGTPVADLLRFNMARGLAGSHDANADLPRRIAHMRAGTPYVTERRFPDGSVIEIRGNPMPGGGFVATFTDVTEFRAKEAALKQAAETLEQRVAARTEDLARASAEAERANQAKTRFLAAVSHDLLQPIHAAHLFTHALGQSLKHGEYLEGVQQIDGALTSAEALLAGLLDISRLDAGGMTPQVRVFALDDVLQHLASEFRVLAAERGLALRCIRTRAWVESDPQLLRRVLQNFLSNAVRYTQRGRVLIGCRRRGAMLSIEVWDTGPGIPETERGIIFEEFRRLDRGSQGLGLGLAIADRITRLLGHRLRLDSRVGRGTVFAVEVPIADAVAAPPPPPAARVEQAPRAKVLVVDNDAAVLKAMQSLLEGWHCEVHAARDADDARIFADAQRPDLMLLDFHLDGGHDGLQLRAQLGAAFADVPTIVITADHSDAVRNAVRAAGCHLLHKPVKPLALKSLMNRLLAASAESGA
ncbi:MAG TPA: PAS domain-containing hybrid sensor histidine kinase/response regulator [Patescibacteria group bacterium]|nr:PAS domain-containing hybrid sensor histidine kinase/response regulator [Patescibacteria group bacterium]